MIKTRRVFIFAHCDDELFCLPLLLEKNSENILIFLTTLDKNGLDSSKVNIRLEEASKANKFLSKFTNIKTIFYNEEIYDGTIHSDFYAHHFDQLTRFVLEEKPDELVTLSYEAGHQDHDSTHLISRLIADNEQLRLRCFSGYRASTLLPRLFSVLKPTSATEKIVFNRILISITAVRLMTIYKSQAKTWIGLGPVLLFKYTLFPFWEATCETLLGTQYIRDCFYESRGRAKQHEVITSHQRFIAQFSTKR